MGQLTERPLAGALAHPAIGYYTRPSHDVVAALNRRRRERRGARCPSTSAPGICGRCSMRCDVPVASQMLVMSKTGVQALYTCP